MTRLQFSLAVGASEKWVVNSLRLLALSPSYTRQESQWLGLVRVLNHEIGLSLARSAELATEALRQSPWSREVILGKESSDSAWVIVDLARYHAAHNAAFSAALILGGPRKRGRPVTTEQTDRSGTAPVRKRLTGETVREMLARATRYGVDLDALRDGVRDSPADRLARLEDNARFIAAMRSATATAPSNHVHTRELRLRKAHR